MFTHVLAPAAPPPPSLAGRRSAALAAVVDLGTRGSVDDGADLGAELSDAQLECVVGGLARALMPAPADLVPREV